MRKQLKVLLLVATVLALFVMAMIVGSAEVEVADGTAFAEAITAAEDGDTIKLTANITLNAGVTIEGKSLTIDGGNFTITLAESVTTGQIFNITAEAFTLQNVTLVANGLTNASGAAADAQLFKINGEVAFRAENVTATFASYLFQLTDPDNDTVGDAMIDFVGCTLTYDGTYQVTRYTHKANPQYITFDGCTITANSVDTVAFKTEETDITFHSCVITTNANIVYSDSKPTNIFVTGANTVINAQYVIYHKTTKAPLNVTFGEDGQTYDMEINCSGAVVGNYRAGNYAGAFTFYSGTYTAPTLVQNLGGTGIVTTIANVTVNGSLLYATAGTFTVTNSTVNGATVASIDAFDAATMFPAANILVVPSALVVNNVAVIDYKLFADTVVLAPAGVMMAADQANDTYVQAVTYAANSYKMYVADAGDFENAAAAGASVRQDLNGLMFATEIAKEDVEAILAKYSVTLADLRFYTLIAPMDYVAKANGVFTKAALDATDIAGVKYVAIQAQNSLLGITGGAWDQDATAVAYSGVLSQLKSQTRGYAAVAMIEFTVGETTTTLYGDFCNLDNARSANQVAAAQ